MKRSRSRLEESDSDNEIDSEGDGADDIIPAMDQYWKSVNGLFPKEAIIENMKPDHQTRPIYVFADGRILLEAFSPIAEQAVDFLIASKYQNVAISRIMRQRLTQYSLYAAVSVGLNTASIVRVLNRLSKTSLPAGLESYVQEHTERYGKLKIVLKSNRFFVESAFPESLSSLLKDEVIAGARIAHVDEHGKDAFLVEELMQDSLLFGTQRQTNPNQNGQSGTQNNSTNEANPIEEELPEDLFSLFDDDSSAPKSFYTASTQRPIESRDETVNEDSTIQGNNTIQLSQDDIRDVSDMPLPPDLDEEDGPDLLLFEPAGAKVMSSFEIDPTMVELVRKRSSELGYPMLEEYDFKNDKSIPDLRIDLKPNTKLRPYQEKSLAKMFGNSRARSGIVVLPCGAGKTLVGVTAACTIKKSCLVLCTSTVSVEQWVREFRSWSNIGEGQIAKFTSQSKQQFFGDSGVLISTYTMLTFSGTRAYDAKKMMDFICSREWGFILLDEVHVVPAEMFRKVLTIVKAHAKLGLTATLVREDDKIWNLNYLIGPKLYEANWQDLAAKGHIAKVQCAEVWCDMTKEFFKEYWEQTSRKRQLLYAMNPNKIQACQYLIEYHEARGDKIIVFSDNVFALKNYATKLGKPFIYGGTSSKDRMRILQQFQYNPALNTVFLSKVGDTSIDIPEASCLIQISSFYGSRRQEAQRLGRILRAKKSSVEGFNAFFYTLVSRDTEEMYYCSKRQQFLLDQGYTFKIISKLEGMDSLANLAYVTLQERLELLATILISNENMFEMDMEEEDIEMDVGTPRATMPEMTVRTGTMSSLSGADSMAYLELPRGGSGSVEFKARSRRR
ncbi:hypothetical protein HDU76_001449 [Blyttiomyces sp. JEL0837]|nr:hypothetical protein HDU76_001449 [Blyttiomyces sp. JEL0837]